MHWSFLPIWLEVPSPKMSNMSDGDSELPWVQTSGIGFRVPEMSYFLQSAVLHS